MQEKSFTLINKGMNRDLSISKAGESSAYENVNIRIDARDKDTLLSVTNEKGNTVVTFSTNTVIEGTLIGWNVLNNHIILFTTNDAGTDRIYRIDYDGDLWRVRAGSTDGYPLYTGNLGFSYANPIESIVYFESEDVQKIYWVDGVHVLRFMNFMADDSEIARWAADTTRTQFDSTKAINSYSFNLISAGQGGESRPNGVIQYILTYFDEYGTESGCAWISDLVYLHPGGKGGSPDGYNNTKVSIGLGIGDNKLDTRFSKYRLYSIFRSSLNGTVTAYIVREGSVGDGTVNISDEGSYLTQVDVSSLLYLGSRKVVPSTLTAKDQTLFLGNMSSIGIDTHTIQDSINQFMFGKYVGGVFTQTEFEDGVTSESYCISFNRTDGNTPVPGIPYVNKSGLYPYEDEMRLTSSRITSFKGGEKYRFALVFYTANGVASQAFWIGDKENTLYPRVYVDNLNPRIDRIFVECTIPYSVLEAAWLCKFRTVQLMIAEASSSDRSVKAQGIINPTVFNVLDRYNGGLYGMPSWITRPRSSEIASMHFEPIHNCTNTTGEIACNYWTYEDENLPGQPKLKPTPYYRLDYTDSVHPKYIDRFDGMVDWISTIVIIGVWCDTASFGIYRKYHGDVTVISGSVSSSDYLSAMKSVTFSSIDWDTDNTYTDPDNRFKLKRYFSPNFMGSGNKSSSRKSLYSKISNYIIDTLGLSSGHVPNSDDFADWCGVALDHANSGNHYYWNIMFPDASSTISLNSALDYYVSSKEARWMDEDNSSISSSDINYIPSEYKKHLMFVDENLITLDSPEISEGLVSFDGTAGLKLRICGVTNITSNIADYTVDATHGHLAGENLVKEEFSGEDAATEGIITWPLWTDNGLKIKETSQDKEVEDRTSDDFEGYNSSIVSYWLYLWGKTGSISGYNDGTTSVLNKKVFANLKYGYNTIYTGDLTSCVYDLSNGGDARVVDSPSGQYTGINVNNKTRYYDGYIDMALSLPGKLSYPVPFSYGHPNPDKILDTYDVYMYSKAFVPITYKSNPHAVIALPSRNYFNNTYKYYEQTILPKIGSSGSYHSHTHNTLLSLTGDLLPWEQNYDSSISGTYKYIDYTTHQDSFTLSSSDIPYFDYNKPYVFIGEIFMPYSRDADGNISSNDIRYGGITEAAVVNNRFIPAGNATDILPFMIASTSGTIYGNQGDTYIQRWDDYRIKPLGSTNENNVIDIVSVLLETHINIAGRYDNQRGLKYIASLDDSTYGKINPVYSQPNNYFSARVPSDVEKTDSYKSAITWTLEKKDLSSIDEWTHITLGSSLLLDGDKGECRALRRIGDSLIAFQDKGIAEILFNSRTQISTEQGVPIEIANSGKVDGKRYITTKYGCINKWSIVEGKSALYFVDNINKAFCAFNGEGVVNISTKLGFESWFRANNSMKPWNASPSYNDNFIGFYDKIHSDVYLVNGGISQEHPTIVYNEVLGTFTTFLSYGQVPMMTNYLDKFISFKTGHLWIQNEGNFCNFFGTQYPFSMMYRVAPSPNDKVWTNLEYRADFFSNSTPSPEDPASAYGYYEPNATFDALQIKNEYQDTGSFTAPVAKKRFRIWRTQIPRAQIDGNNNPYGLDRIRNPWIHLKFTKYADANSNRLMQLHDITVKYFE